MLLRGLLLSCLIFVAACAVRSPLARFEQMKSASTRPAIFSELLMEPSQAAATIRLKAPGLRGKARGIVRHAGGGNYLVELYGRNELFLKVYFTSSQTVLWPSAGMPRFFSPNEIPTLNSTVHSRLPNWRLDDVLPVPLISQQSDSLFNEYEWATDSKNRVMARISRPGCSPLLKLYEKKSGRIAFPHKVVTLSNESGSSKVIWSLEPITRK